MNRELDELRENLQHFLHEGRHRPYFPGDIAPDSWAPAVDVYEVDETVVVVVDLAGVSPETVDVTVTGRTLRIVGTRVPRFRDGHLKFHHLEIPFGTFKREVTLPAGVADDSIEARYHEGFLQIVLPVPRPVHPPITRTAERDAT